MRIAVLTYESYQANLIIQRLLAECPGRVVGIMASTATIAGKGTWQALWFLAARTGWGFTGRKGVEILLGRAAGATRALAGRTVAVPRLRELARAGWLPMVGARDVNAPDAVERLRGWRPDLVVSVHLNQRIRSRILGLASRGVINVHGSLLPRNRGLFPYFWTLADGEGETGVTVHWVDADFDTGDVLLQERVGITPVDSVFSLGLRCAERGADLLVRAVQLVEAGNPPRTPQDERHASYGSWPTGADLRRLRGRGRRYGLVEAWRELVGGRAGAPSPHVQGGGDGSGDGR
jgi:folate-dependent phosphoribosylglycinamide formyltransferase PurN